MDTELLRARLNLNAVLQNLAELVKLDAEMAALSKPWDISIQFSVMSGPAAFVEFKNGVCKHGAGTHPSPTVRLFFTSPAHLNRMFAGKGMPIPLKGFTKLGFLQKDFAKLTQRLEQYLKPAKDVKQDAAFVNTSTSLTLYTAAYAVKELAALEPTCKAVAAHTPNGGLQIGVQPEGPYVHLLYDKGAVAVGKGSLPHPAATMTFKDMPSAHGLLSGKLDAFQAVAEGSVMLHGMIPIIDNTSLILDRVEQYLA